MSGHFILINGWFLRFFLLKKGLIVNSVLLLCDLAKRRAPLFVCQAKDYYVSWTTLFYFYLVFEFKVIDEFIVLFSFL